MAYKLRVVLFLSLLMSPCLSYGQVRNLSLGEIVKSAGMIFSGVVTEVRGATDENGEIVTYTSFKVDKPITEISSNIVTIKQLGGEYNGLTTRIADMHYFERGERVIVGFYPVSSLGFTSPVGMNQGVWKIAENGSISGISQPSLEGINRKLLQKAKIGDCKTAIAASNFISLLKSMKKGGNVK